MKGLKPLKLEVIGERKAIDIISHLLTEGDVPVGIGDDCAALDMGDDYLLVTTDMIRQKTHAPMSTARQIGWHLVAINISDIGSKGGRPLGLVTALGLPKGTTVSFLKELSKGIDACAKRFETSIIGGDTKESKELILTGTAFGLVNKKNFMPRGGARPGDYVAVTGELGTAAAGLEALKTNLKRPKAIKALLEPWPRVNEGISLGETRVINACMDISDGLSSSLHQMAKASKVGFRIEHETLPVSMEVRKMGLVEDDATMHFGGEYELLMTLRPKDIDVARKAVEDHGTRFTVIGTVVKSGICLARGVQSTKIEDKGWEHFRPVPKVRKVRKKKRRKRKKSGSRSSR